MQNRSMSFLQTSLRHRLLTLLRCKKRYADCSRMLTTKMNAHFSSVMTTGLNSTTDAILMNLAVFLPLAFDQTQVAAQSRT
ncbi:hypothetical protein Enr13x_39280 [Stieleria neptunia]|uniref:Uncharacterized protein n=1 Tax=Stieleria neptunia TaxID=2527979 RepID=A0A518HTE7_9BACT|nr:hypothetical protein Enr13x_39280 [Stieleria neptunia]